MKEIKISLLITLYKGSNPEWFDECLNSVYGERRFIAEVVLVADGELSHELDDLIAAWEKKWEFNKVYLEKNLGPGGASQKGLENCKYEWVARLDADDIASPNRFARQVEFLQEHPDVDVLGGYMPEFKDRKEETFAVNYVPLTHKQIARRLSLRSPMINSSSIFRRKLALQAGGYQRMMSHEDHLLWMSLLQKKARFANLPTLMGYYRASPQYYERRRGLNVIRTELIFQNFARQRGYISHYEYYRNLLLRIPPRFLPGFLLKPFYNIFLRRRIRYQDIK